jgi:hypothetical protein
MGFQKSNIHNVVSSILLSILGSKVDLLTFISLVSTL